MNKINNKEYSSILIQHIQKLPNEIIKKIIIESYTQSKMLINHINNYNKNVNIIKIILYFHYCVILHNNSISYLWNFQKELLFYLNNFYHPYMSFARIYHIFRRLLIFKNKNDKFISNLIDKNIFTNDYEQLVNITNTYMGLLLPNELIDFKNQIQQKYMLQWSTRDLNKFKNCINDTKNLPTNLFENLY